MKVLVVHPGLQDTIQDLGRTAFWSYGVPEGGAADRASLVLANRLVGNQDEAAGLEFTLRGPVLTFPEGGFVAFTGALFEIKRSAGSFARNTTIRLAPGETLEIGKAILGCRGYLALSGGIEVKAVLDSRSTFLPAGFGGMRGRALCQGDELLIGQESVSQRMAEADWDSMPRRDIRVMAGPQMGMFSDSALIRLFSSAYEVTSKSDRSGIRLRGHSLPISAPTNLPSQGVLPGAIQVPPDGQPIITGRDGPVTGGYPVVAGVISADLDRLSQLRPGDKVGFVAIGQPEAARAWRDYVKDLDRCITWLD